MLAKSGRLVAIRTVPYISTLTGRSKSLPPSFFFRPLPRVSRARLRVYVPAEKERPYRRKVTHTMRMLFFFRRGMSTSFPGGSLHRSKYLCFKIVEISCRKKVVYPKRKPEICD